MKIAFFLFLYLLSSLCHGVEFQLLKVWEYDHQFKVGDHILGGLSGLSYSKAENLFYAVSDNRSAPLVFPIKLKKKKEWVLEILPPHSIQDDNTLDLEEIVAVKSGFWLSNENSAGTNSLLFIDKNFQIKRSLDLPEFMHSYPFWLSYFFPKGLQFNKELESLCLNEKEELESITEAPLAGEEQATWIVMDKAGKLKAQSKYPLDAKPHNGVVDLRCQEGKRWVLERSYDKTKHKNSIRLYEAEFSSLHKKQLILDFDNVKKASTLRVDNIESMSEGAPFQQGQLFLFISDNNFSTHQKTQFWLFKLSSSK